MKRYLLALASFAIALLIARSAWHELRPRSDTVSVVNTAPALFQEFERRALEVGAEIEQPGLVRVPLDERCAALFFPANEGAYEYDPLAYSRPRPNPEPEFSVFPEHPAGGFHLRVNRQGMREDQDVRAEKRDLRILVVGDSHTYGLCANGETFANLLEAELAAALPARDVEVLNAGGGYYNFFNYLGVFERFRELAADLVIVVAYGGNDFSGSAVLQRYFRACPAPTLGPWTNRASELPPGAGFQETVQAIHLLNNPDDEARAVQAATQVTLELARQCREQGVELLVAYLPPPTRGQPELYADLAHTCREILGLDEKALESSDRMADAWLAAAREGGIETLDLRAGFAAAGERLYWATDLHLNLAGHRTVAEELLPRVVALLARL